jgi:hypothetical protein
VIVYAMSSQVGAELFGGILSIACGGVLGFR